MADRVAILLDGEWVRKTLKKQHGSHPDHSDIVAEVERIKGHQDVVQLDIYRVFYYTAEPLTGDATNPISGRQIDFGSTDVYSRNKQLIDRLDNQPDFAVRRGQLTQQGWKLGRAAMQNLTSGSKSSVQARDLLPNIQQKGVDMRLGLDIASLALKRLVRTVVLVSGDSDLVPAMKLARIEGLRVFLDTLGSKQVRPELKVHADRIL